MNNDFFAFVETYKEDIIAFFEALKGFFEALFAKLSGDASEDTTAE